jgi:ankyrin repeat protein
MPTTVGTGTLKLAHLSVKEYLLSQRIRNGSVKQYSLEKRLSDTLISQTCLIYLLHFEEIGSLDSEITPTQYLESATDSMPSLQSISLTSCTDDPFPLANYAAKHWISHARSDDGIIPETLQPLIVRLLHPRSAQFAKWIQHFDSNIHSSKCWLFANSISSSIYYAALRGLFDILEQLLREKGADVNVPGGEYGNALQAASFQGHEAVVRMLVDNGADINAQGGKYGNALQAASRQGHKAVVRMLLDNGADINAQGGKYGNALQAALCSGYWPVVRILADNGADVNTQGEFFENLLQVASGEGDEEFIRRLLLEKAADIADGGGEALEAASYAGHEAVVRLLLDNGVNINAQGGKYGNALQAASYGGHKAVVQMLLDNGADINAHGGVYGNALQAASHNGHEAVVQMLLDNRADINAQGGKYGSALQAASYGDHEEVVQMLLHNGAVINVKEGELWEDPAGNFIWR